VSVIDNASGNAGRFELSEQGKTAYADYRREGDILTILHVYAPPALRGTGTAGRLMEGIVAAAKAEGRKIAPACSYAAAWLEKHPQA
jgi:hypothetical protein